MNCQNSIQSASSWFNSVIGTFSACVPNYLPILILVWIFSTVVCDCGIFPDFIDLFEIISYSWIYWCMFVLFGAFPFQTVVMDTNANDSFEQLLNQFVPLNQHWFSSDRAWPRFRAGAVRQKKTDFSAAWGGVEGPVRLNSGKFPVKEAQEDWNSGPYSTASSQLGNFEIFSCRPRSKITVRIRGYSRL